MSTSSGRPAWAACATGWAAVLLAIACGPSVPPPTKVASPPVAPSASTAPVASAPVEEPLPPGELRCGVDDGPVPVGLGEDGGDEDDLRHRARAGGVEPAPDGARALLGLRVAERPPPPVNAAKPKVTVQFKLGEGVLATDAFTRRARPCALAGQTSDEGERSFSVRFSRGGVPIGVRIDDGPLKDGVVTRCFAAALCSSGGAPGADASSGVRKATLAVKVSPPVFTGRVRMGLRDDRPSSPSPGPRRGRGGVPEPAPYTAEERKYVTSLDHVLGKGALACAQRTPPAARLTLTVELRFDKQTRAFSAGPARGRNDFEKTLAACVGEAAAESLKPPPARMMPNGTLAVVATFTPGEVPIDALGEP